MQLTVGPVGPLDQMRGARNGAIGSVLLACVFVAATECFESGQACSGGAVAACSRAECAVPARCVLRGAACGQRRGRVERSDRLSMQTCATRLTR